jgi:hypothetical protein
MIMLSKRMAAAYKDKKKEESGNITYIYDEKHIKKRNRQKAKKVERLEKFISDLSTFFAFCLFLFLICFSSYI